MGNGVPFPAMTPGDSHIIFITRTARSRGRGGRPVQAKGAELVLTDVDEAPLIAARICINRRRSEFRDR
jgi:hypothetical protein